MLRSDAAGNTWTVVEFAAPVPDEAEVSATGTGKRNPTTGALLENPAEIIEDVLRLAGRAESWDFLRAECAAAGLRLAGSITESKSIRATIDDIATSAAAIWTPSMARLYPTATVAGYVQELDKMLVANLIVKADLTNTADVVRVFYDPDSASAKAQHFVELSSNPQIYGGVVREFTLDSLRTPGNAEAVCRRLLPWFAGERYDVTFDCGDKSVRPGQWVRLVGHPEWPFSGADPEVMILGADVEQNSKTAQCRGVVVLTAPGIAVTGHSVALPTTRNAGVEVGVKDGGKLPRDRRKRYAHLRRARRPRWWAAQNHHRARHGEFHRQAWRAQTGDRGARHGGQGVDGDGVRYGLELVPVGAFGPDVEIGVRLQQEPAIVVPEECPECPPGACEPAFSSWVVWGVGYGALGTGFNVTLVLMPYIITCHRSRFTDSFIVLIPQMTRCGHATRFVITATDWPYGSEVASGLDRATETSADPEVAMVIFNSVFD